MYGNARNINISGKPTTPNNNNSNGGSSFSSNNEGLSSSANSSSSSGSASATELDNILNTMKECNYTLVNSITAVEEIQREKDLIEQLLAQGKFNDEKRLKKLQYSISYESETLMKTLMKLDGLQIVGHIKHSHRIKKERKKERAREREREIEMMGNLEGVDDDDNNSRSSSTGTSSSSGSSSGSDDESLPKFGPHRLRKYRKRLVNRIIRLIDYLDALSKEAKALVKKFEEVKSKQTTTTTTSTSTSSAQNKLSQEKEDKKYQPASAAEEQRYQRPTSANKNRSESFNDGNQNYYKQNYHQQHEERPRSQSNGYNPFEFQDFGNLDTFISQGHDDYYDDDNIHNEHTQESPFFESPSQKLHKYRSNNPRPTHNHLPNFFKR
ncbi:hypothetical protein CYY_003125 [Polysphondylium violaceum]|uniref:BAG domain-containing protein n=1 Tax=Polysphondylium violaceum TaxID=133409 RepID=A0A8J4Q082_9MYCE|nr:hypothetical protein CYY_003125 [Polysphondylium violaceum]